MNRSRGKKPKFVQLLRSEEEEFPDVPKEPLIKIVPRDEWGAAPPKKTETLKIPVDHVRYNQTDTDICLNKPDCFELLQKLQKDHMENKGMTDIQYNFMIAGDGTVYEGRGWETKGKVHDALKDKDYLDVAYIGKFGRLNVPVRQIYSFYEFLSYAVAEKYLTEVYEMEDNRGHAKPKRIPPEVIVTGDPFKKRKF